MSKCKKIANLSKLVVLVGLVWIMLTRLFSLMKGNETEGRRVEEMEERGRTEEMRRSQRGNKGRQKLFAENAFYLLIHKSKPLPSCSQNLFTYFTYRPNHHMNPILVVYESCDSCVSQCRWEWLFTYQHPAWSNGGLIWLYKTTTQWRIFVK